MLQISHLYKNYGKFQAVRDLNLHVPKGDLFGFVGIIGAVTILSLPKKKA